MIKNSNNKMHKITCCIFTLFTESELMADKMKTITVFLVSISLSVLLAGCLTVSQYRFSLNFDTGEIKREYCDLRSKQGVDEKNYSVSNDWAGLKEMIAKQKSEFDPDVVEDISKDLSEENNVLCGRKIQKVKCPKCFPSKAAIMAYVHEKEWRFELINDEVALILPSYQQIISTNGYKVTTPKSSMIFWPQESSIFEYVVSEQNSEGISLLPNYLEEKNLKK